MEKERPECWQLCPLCWLINTVYSPEAARHLKNAKREMLLALRAMAAKQLSEERREIKRIEIEED